MNPTSYNMIDEAFAQARKGGSPNPFYLISSQFLPRTYSDVIRWSRFVMTQSPTLTEVIRKQATYPITEFIIDTPNENHKKKWKELIKSLKLKNFLNEVGFNHYSLGNVYISIYFPIKRFLKCPTCNTEYEYTSSQKFIKFKNFKFEGTCQKCDMPCTFERIDRKSMAVEDMNLISWPAEHVAVHRNPITNACEYYYNIPNYVKKGVMLGDPLYISSTPWSIIEAVKDGKEFKFDNKNFYHLKNLSMGDMLNGYGVPPLISLYSLVFYQVLLRRANEAIATEHLTPMRMISPRQGSAGADPSIQLNMKNFARNMEENIRKFKKDPNHIVISPVPADIGNLGGEGRALLITQELQASEETILMGMGVPRELMAGTINWQSSTVGLRLLENIMTGYIIQIKDLLEWIADKINTYHGFQDVKLDMVPFKLTDDEQLRQQLAALVQQNAVSLSTYLKAFNLDLEEELNKMKDDASKMAAHEIEKDHVVALTKFARAKDVASDRDTDDAFSKTQEKAVPIAQQIIEIQDPNEQKKSLMLIKSKDPGMYEQVVHYMNQYINAPTTAGGADPQQLGGGADPSNKQSPPEQAQGDSQGDPTNNPGAQQPQGN